MYKCLVSIFFLFYGLKANSDVANGDRVCGKWISAEKNLIVQVYKSDDQFRAKIVWFSGEPGHKIEEYKDIKNPNPELRKRRVLGMDILRDLKYDADSNSWEDGMVYDALHGHEWNAAAYIDNQGLLRVRGYWHFKFIGRTMTFHRVPEPDKK